MRRRARGELEVEEQAAGKRNRTAQAGGDPRRTLRVRRRRGGLRGRRHRVRRSRGRCGNGTVGRRLHDGALDAVPELGLRGRDAEAVPSRKPRPSGSRSCRRPTPTATPASRSPTPQPDLGRREGPHRGRDRQRRDHPGARLRRGEERSGGLDRHRPGRRARRRDRPRGQRRHGRDRLPGRSAKAIGGTGKVLSLEGAFTSINGRDRTNGFHDCMKESFPNIELIEQPDPLETRPSELGRRQTVLTSTPDLKAIYMQSRLRDVGGRLNVLKSCRPARRRAEPGHIYRSASTARRSRLKKIRERLAGRRDLAAARPLRQVWPRLSPGGGRRQAVRSSARPITTSRIADVQRQSDGPRCRRRWSPRRTSTTSTLWAQPGQIAPDGVDP